MKNLWKNRILLLFAATLPLIMQAQSDDDLYYDPVWDVSPEPMVNDVESTPPVSTYREELPEYQDDYDDYEYWEDQGYFYSSRLRRFHNPYRGFDYYDPVYTDLGFYDPWIMPGSSIYINIGAGNDYRSWRRYNRMHWGPSIVIGGGWNTWGWRQYSDPWSYNRWGAYRVYDPWFDPFWGGACFNQGWNYGWNNGWNNGWGSGWGNNYYVNNNYYYNDVYNQPGYWNGNGNGNVNQNPKGTHYGPRLPGARTGPSRGTVRDPEYVGGGIPILKESIGRPAGNTAGDQDGNGSGRVLGDNNGVRDRDVSTVRPGLDQPSTPRNQQVKDPVRRDPLAPSADPSTRPNDPMKDRKGWSDIPDKRPTEQTDRPVREEKSRDSYRDEYLRHRQAPPTAEPRTFPDSRTRSRTDRSPQTRPNQDDNRSNRRPAQTFPDRKKNDRKQDRPTYQAPPPTRQQTPSRTFDRPTRNNSNSGGNLNGGSDSSKQRSNSNSGGTSGRKKGRGGDQ
ncbi:MAG: hypothetical protein K9I85_07795 [Saprospiraceae bacterium]|nr:hypothetical protein [Saprospiraceae bacterium]